MASNKTKSESPGHGPSHPDEGGAGIDDSIKLGPEGDYVMKLAGGIGLGFLVVSVGLGAAAGDQFKQFFHSYLVAFMWGLSIVLGALFWITLQHLVNAKWSVVVRRVAELLAQGLSLMLVLALPILVTVAQHNDVLFPWLNSELVNNDHVLHGKVGYLNVPFFLIRMAIYFGFWILLARFYLKRSLDQDATGTASYLSTMAKAAPPSMIAFALTLTFAAIDLIMTLDPMWFSTIFGVYYFAGCVLAVHSTLTLALFWLQSNRRLVKSVTIEHYHDIGKMMFAFTVFWAYIAFSQFMLIWYANIPEETHWYAKRFEGEWLAISYLLVVLHFVVPFFFLLSRQIKRNPKTLSIGAVWLLVVQFLDLHWLIMPNLHRGGFSFHPLDVTTLLGVACLLVAFVLFQAKKVNLVPIKDPRLKRSLAFENI